MPVFSRHRAIMRRCSAILITISAATFFAFIYVTTFHSDRFMPVEEYGLSILDIPPEERIGEIPLTHEPEDHEEEIPTDFDIDDKIIVMGKLTTEDTDWVANELSDWKRAIYITNDTTAELHTPMNKGHEALPYLTYIIDNYNNLPWTMAFIHSHKDGWKEGWHTDNNDYSNVVSLQHLNLTFVQRKGYVNLRCNGNPGCPHSMHPYRKESTNREIHNDEIHIRELWPQLFGNIELPPAIGVPCCAQFAVSRNQVHKRPLQDYIHFRKVIMDTTMKDHDSGRVMEHVWHIIFNKPPVYCPQVKKCYLNVYGWKVVITGHVSKQCPEGDRIEGGFPPDKFRYLC